MTKKFFILTGKNFAIDDYIPALTANPYRAITGQHNFTPTYQDFLISEALRSLTEEIKQITAKINQNQPL